MDSARVHMQRKRLLCRTHHGPLRQWVALARCCVPLPPAAVLILIILRITTAATERRPAVQLQHVQHLAGGNQTNSEERWAGRSVEPASHSLQSERQLPHQVRGAGLRQHQGQQQAVGQHHLGRHVRCGVERRVKSE